MDKTLPSDDAIRGHLGFGAALKAFLKEKRQRHHIFAREIDIAPQILSDFITGKNTDPQIFQSIITRIQEPKYGFPPEEVPTLIALYNGTPERAPFLEWEEVYGLS